MINPSIMFAQAELSLSNDERLTWWRALYYGMATLQDEIDELILFYSDTED
jgi:hypothetical protein